MLNILLPQITKVSNHDLKAIKIFSYDKEITINVEIFSK